MLKKTPYFAHFMQGGSWPFEVQVLQKEQAVGSIWQKPFIARFTPVRIHSSEKENGKKCERTQPMKSTTTTKQCKFPNCLFVYSTALQFRLMPCFKKQTFIQWAVFWTMLVRQIIVSEMGGQLLFVACKLVILISNVITMFVFTEPWQ